MGLGDCGKQELVAARGHKASQPSPDYGRQLLRHHWGRGCGLFINIVNITINNYVNNINIDKDIVNLHQSLISNNPSLFLSAYYMADTMLRI